MIRGRYKANSRYVSIEAYPFALPCGERIEGERIDASVVDIKTERIRCPAVDIKRTVDMSPLKRIRLRSHAASELKAKGSMRARER